MLARMVELFALHGHDTIDIVDVLVIALVVVLIVWLVRRF